MPSSSLPSAAICVLGAGSSGLTVLKNLLAAQLPAVCFEADSDLGGVWRSENPISSVYDSAHLISSKRLTEFVDFPLPDDYPAYPSREQVIAYFRAYAERFDLRRAIQFNASITRLEPLPAGWRVHFADGTQRDFACVVIANGHNWDPRWPDYPGQFRGEILHSAHYKRPAQFAGKRVLVVGGGNSGCDLAVEAAQHAALTYHSLRRGYHFLPKFIGGRPTDACGEWLLRLRLPLWLRRWITSQYARITLGRPAQFGLPVPDHRLLESHPIINSQMLYQVGHGRIKPRPDVTRLDGNTVHFVDGSRVEVDLIVYATGFKLSFPFIDLAELNWQEGKPNLFLKVFHPTRSDLFVTGMIQPDSGQWGLVDEQARLMTAYLQARQTAPGQIAWFERLKAGGDQSGSGIHYLRSPRHLLEIEHYAYRRQLQTLTRRLQRSVRQ